MKFQLVSDTSNQEAIASVIYFKGTQGNENIINQLSEKKIQLAAKRSFDIAVSSLLIILFSPILIMIATIIRVTSKGNILYSNERVGLNGINFRCFKFRSMVTDQSSRLTDHAAALAGQEKGMLHKVKNDTRITWIGKIIRRTSMDELPQLFNVLKET